MKTNGFIFALPVVLLCSCGWIVGEIAAEKVRNDAVRSRVYEHSGDELWQESGKLWDDVGCKLASDPKVDETFTCEGEKKRWFRMEQVSGGHAVKFEIEEAHKVTNEKGEWVTRMDRTRDWDLEWRLFERLEPEQAAEVEKKAGERGEKAKKATRDLFDAFE